MQVLPGVPVPAGEPETGTHEQYAQQQEGARTTTEAHQWLR
jgi:hypothetical protein